ncbi:hypothetical protein LK459_09535 [Gordonia otitidis]|uniref:hypothetical protein n=1 Tax=Gordonia otitidis TaxID=249058 RepID=UPI001D14563B|nr:hypothetical protein [Gordonia otitidis]UEA61032.1 hypothetical protein LK459_09535 [Gordonia otitidis]
MDFTGRDAGDLEQWAANADIGVLTDHEAMLIRGFLCRASSLRGENPRRGLLR